MIQYGLIRETLTQNEFNPYAMKAVSEIIEENIRKIKNVNGNYYFKRNFIPVILKNDYLVQDYVNEFLFHIPTFDYRLAKKEDRGVYNDRNLSLLETVIQNRDDYVIILVQVLLSLHVAQEKCQFMHGNLIGDNVEVQNTIAPYSALIQNKEYKVFPSGLLPVITNFESSTLCLENGYWIGNRDMAFSPGYDMYTFLKDTIEFAGDYAKSIILRFLECSDNNIPEEISEQNSRKLPMNLVNLLIEHNFEYVSVKNRRKMYSYIGSVEKEKRILYGKNATNTMTECPSVDSCILTQFENRVDNGRRECKKKFDMDMLAYAFVIDKNIKLLSMASIYNTPLGLIDKTKEEYTTEMYMLSKTYNEIVYMCKQFVPDHRMYSKWIRRYLNTDLSMAESILYPAYLHIRRLQSAIAFGISENEEFPFSDSESDQDDSLSEKSGEKENIIDQDINQDEEDNYSIATQEAEDD